MTRLRQYIGHDDGLAAVGNLLSLSIACNQPFYPFTLAWVTGALVPASFWTLLSTPGFLLVPAVTRRSPLLGRTLLVLTGLANTLLCLLLYGEDSGVSLFFLPCGLIAALLFRPEEKRAQWPLVGLAVLAFIGLHQHVPARTALVPAAAYPALWSLHAASVALLIAFIGLLRSGRDPAKAGEFN